MRHWLASAEDQGRKRWVRRFDPRFWTVDFPRPMMAAVTSVGDHGLAVDAVFLRRNDLAGLIWESRDRWTQPLLALETARDYRGLVLRFGLRIEGGALPLDAVNGPVLTIEGRDAEGAAKNWFVRLWNYAPAMCAMPRLCLISMRWTGGFCCLARRTGCLPGTLTGCSFRWWPTALTGLMRRWLPL